jgi:hypothetical protein
MEGRAVARGTTRLVRRDLSPLNISSITVGSNAQKAPLPTGSEVIASSSPSSYESRARIS